MLKTFFVCMLSYLIIVTIILIADTSLKYELIAAFGLYTYMVIMFRFVINCFEVEK